VKPVVFTASCKLKEKGRSRIISADCRLVQLSTPDDWKLTVNYGIGAKSTSDELYCITSTEHVKSRAVEFVRRTAAERFAFNCDPANVEVVDFIWKA
jgi:hypothetical protein